MRNSLLALSNVDLRKRYADKINLLFLFLCAVIIKYWRRHGDPLQHSSLENPMDRGTWQGVVQRVVQNQTQLKRLSTRYQILLFCCVAEAYEEGPGAFSELFYFMNNCLIVHLLENRCWDLLQHYLLK